MRVSETLNICASWCSMSLLYVAVDLSRLHRRDCERMSAWAWPKRNFFACRCRSSFYTEPALSGAVNMRSRRARPSRISHHAICHPSFAALRLKQVLREPADEIKEKAQIVTKMAEEVSATAKIIYMQSFG